MIIDNEPTNLRRLVIYTMIVLEWRIQTTFQGECGFDKFTSVQFVLNFIVSKHVKIAMKCKDGKKLKRLGSVGLFQSNTLLGPQHANDTCTSAKKHNINIYRATAKAEKFYHSRLQLKTAMLGQSERDPSESSAN